MNRIPVALDRLLSGYGATVTAEREIQNGTQYTLNAGAERATLNVYSTGRTSEGGKETPLKELLRNYRESTGKNGKRAASVPKRVAVARVGTGSPFTIPNATPRVGTDEAGKGDYFGPLVVAGVRVRGKEEDEALRGIGVRDSKLLSLVQTTRMANEIKDEVGESNCVVISLSPRDYELRRERSGRNVNRLLGELNAQVISALQGEVEAAVVDQFSTKAREYIESAGITDLRIETRPRAEDDAAVAAASILARARYLEEMEMLSRSVGFELPRGSTHVLDAAGRVVEEFGEAGLARVAKIHFSITDRVLGNRRITDERRANDW